MDSRDIWAATAPWYTKLDQRRMVATVALAAYDEEDEHMVEVPIRFAVCPLCGGKGSHVNPSIDSEGLTAEDFAADPDFAESYQTGMYDVACNRCGGERVIAEPDPERCEPSVLNAIREKMAGDYEYACQSVIEREMGY